MPSQPGASVRPGYLVLVLYGILGILMGKVIGL